MENNMTLIKFMLQGFKQHKLKVFFILMILIMIALLQFKIPQITQVIIDDVIINADKQKLVIQLALLLLMTILIAFLSFFSNYYIVRLSQASVSSLRKDMYAHILGMDFAYFDNHKTGDIMERISGDVSQLQDLFSSSTFNIIGNAVTFVWVCVFITINDYKLMVLIALTFPILFLLNRFFKKYIKKAYRKFRASSSEINHHLQVSLTSVPLIKNYVNEEYELNKFNELILKNNDNLFEATNISSLYGPSLSIIEVVGVMIVLSYGALSVMNGNMSVGMVVSYLSYLSLLQKPMRSFSSIINRYQQADVSFERIMELLKETPNITSKSDAIVLEDDSYSIVFDDVTFAYEDKEIVLDDINFEIESSKVTALVGTSGSGKTTITRLLMRYYDVLDGHITINNTDLRDYDLDSLRRKIGVVSQDVDIVDGSVLENVTYGTSSYSFEEVEDACNKANILEFIKSLPSGFETEVGERGVKLSGGQKQRIALARAFMKNAPILILDESTAALDNESERYIQRSLEGLIEDKTSLVIAHRLSTIQNADNILVLEDGKIVEQGTHDELLAMSKRYYEIYHSQFE